MKNVRKKLQENSTAQSIKDCQKWIDYDMTHYKKISQRTNDLVKKAGFQIQKNQYGDYEVTAGKFESVNEKYAGPYGKQQIGWMKNQAEDYDDIEYSQYPNYDKSVTVIGGQRVPVYIYPTAEDCGHSFYYAFKTTDGGWKHHMPYIYNLKKYADDGDFEIASDWKLLDKYPYLEYIGKKESMKESTDTIRIKGIDVKVYPGTWEDFEKEKDFDKFSFDKIYTVDGKKYKVMHNKENVYEYAIPLVQENMTEEIMNESDGWNIEHWAFDNVMEVISDIEEVAYELRSCVKGSYTQCKNYSELSQLLKNLGEELSKAAEDVADAVDNEDDDIDESKKVTKKAVVKKETKPVTASLNKKVEEQVKEEFDDTVSTYFSHYLD